MKIRRAKDDLTFAFVFPLFSLVRCISLCEGCCVAFSGSFGSLLGGNGLYDVRLTFWARGVMEMGEIRRVPDEARKVRKAAGLDHFGELLWSGRYLMISSRHSSAKLVARCDKSAESSRPKRR